MQKLNLSRREFAAAAATSAVAAATWVETSSRAEGRLVNDTVTVALIGVGGMGGGHLSSLLRTPGARVVAICDVDESMRHRASEAVRKATGKSLKLVVDHREVLDDKSIDAVLIATPHHWHCPIALPALQAGKEVYVEKPASHSFQEGQLLAALAKKHNRIVQHGTQMRSSGLLPEARAVLDSGILGPIVMSRAWNIQGKKDVAPVPDSQVPPGVDYDRWLGPAPVRPFNLKRFHRTWRMYRDYGNGDFGDDGAHDLDMARWGLGVTTHPVKITAHGSNMFGTGIREYPDNMMVSFQYADGKILTYEERVGFAYGQNGVDSSNAFYGTEGYMIFTRRGFFRTYLGRKEKPGPASGKSGRVGAPVPSHLENFLTCVRTRERPMADTEVAHLTCGLIHLGEIAYRTATVLEFDPTLEKITNSERAAAMLAKKYRKPYGIPDVS